MAVVDTDAMSLARRVSEMRNDQILRKAQPFLGEGEEVVDWVRARDPEDGRRGIFFITSERALVAWSGKDGHGHVMWTQVRSWGLNQERREGPVLCIETLDEELSYVQLAVSTPQMARTAASFIRAFAELAPWPTTSPTGEGFEPRSVTDVEHSPRTPGEMAKRVAITVLGAGLIIVGILIIPLPGPWTFVLNIAGLAVLAREYDWADDLLDWTKERFEDAKRKIAERKTAKRNKKRSQT